MSSRDESASSPPLPSIRAVIFRKESVKPTPSDSASPVNDVTYTSQGTWLLRVFLDE